MTLNAYLLSKVQKFYLAKKIIYAIVFFNTQKRTVLMAQQTDKKIKIIFIIRFALILFFVFLFILINLPHKPFEINFQKRASAISEKEKHLSPISLVLWPHSPTILQDAFFKYLNQQVYQKGYYLVPQNKNNPTSTDLLFVMWKSYNSPLLQNKDTSFLFLYESPIGIQIPPSLETEKHFKKIFTYDKSLATRPPFVFSLLQYSFDDIDWRLFNAPKTILSVQIASNFYNKKSIYEKRREIAHYFIENHPNDFVLYGREWNSFTPTLSEIGQENFKTSYKNTVSNKIQAASSAKFMFAFENAQHTGYISEKIFDAMKAGAIPIYLGAPNVTDYIPTTCFIDSRQFKTPEELYNYLKYMPEETYQDYRKNIKAFIQNFDKTPFYYKNVVDIMIQEIFPENPTQADILQHP